MLIVHFWHNAVPLNISREPPVKSGGNFGQNYVPRTLCYTVHFIPLNVASHHLHACRDLWDFSGSETGDYMTNLI